MAFIVKDEKKPRVLPPAGSRLARCVWMIDLGTQEVSYPGSDPYETRKIYVSWELPTTKHVFKQENGEEPFMIGQEFTVSFSTKAKLRGFLEDWRGRQYSEKELKDPGVDLQKLVEVPCRLNLVHGTTQAGNPKCTIKSISPLGEDETCPRPHNVRICLVLTKEEFSVRDWLNTPKWLQDICKKSPEYQHLERIGVVDGTYRPGDEDELPDEWAKKQKALTDERKEFEAQEEAAASTRPSILDKPDNREFSDSDVPF